MALLLVFVSVLVASAVEAFEAVVIVGAVASEIGSRRAIASALLAVLVLIALTGAFGAVLLALPMVKLVAGAVLFCFGARWLVKSTLKLSGRMATHHESEPTRVSRWTGQLIAFKGTFVEGIEITVIVVGFAGGHTSWAIAGAVAAIALVLVTGWRLRRVLTGIPKVWLKLVVGSMMMTFGVVFGGEGLGVEWPTGAATLLLGALIFVGLGLTATRLLRRPTGAEVPA